MARGYSTKFKIKMVQAYLTYKEPLSKLVKISRVSRLSLKRWAYQVKYYLNHNMSMKYVAIKHRIDGNEIQQ